MEKCYATKTPLISIPTSNTTIAASPAEKNSGPSEGIMSPSPSRRLVFGLHSPVCRDEIIKPVELGGEITPTSANKKVPSAPIVKAALRTKSRVISSEDAIKATDAIVDPQVSVTLNSYCILCLMLVLSFEHIYYFRIISITNLKFKLLRLALFSLSYDHQRKH